MNFTDSAPITITLHIAAVLSAFLWPIIVISILIIYHDKIPLLFEWLVRHIKKIEFQGLSIELTDVKAFDPMWTISDQDVDLRKPSLAGDTVVDQFITLNNLLREQEISYCLIINLDNGRTWSASRIFILSLLFLLTKGIKAVVFLESAEAITNTCIGWAETEKVISSFSHRYPWFEESYITAYRDITKGEKAFNFIISPQGHPISRYLSPSNYLQTGRLMIAFLKEIQRPELPSEERIDWIQVGSDPVMYEHSSWMTGMGIRDILGDNLLCSTVSRNRIDSENDLAKVREFMPVFRRFIPVISKDRRFECLIDRNRLLEQVVQKLTVGE